MAEAAGVDGTARVLVVDDDRDFAAFYVDILAAQGFTVEIARTGDEAIRTLEAAPAPFEVVLLDQKLHGAGGPSSGLDLIPQVRALAPLVEIILVTGYATPDVIRLALLRGANDYVIKTGDFEHQLRSKVRVGLAATRARASGTGLRGATSSPRAGR